MDHFGLEILQCIESLLKLGRPDDALVHAETLVLQTMVGDVEQSLRGPAYRARATVRLKLKDADGAYLDACQAVALEPRDAKNWDVRGNVTQALGKWEESRAARERALALEPTPERQLILKCSPSARDEDIYTRTLKNLCGCKITVEIIRWHEPGVNIVLAWTPSTHQLTSGERIKFTFSQVLQVPSGAPLPNIDTMHHHAHQVL
jgi:tetratricopeptide (TPR) repeat protein